MLGKPEENARAMARGQDDLTLSGARYRMEDQ